MDRNYHKEYTFKEQTQGVMKQTDQLLPTCSYTSPVTRPHLQSLPHVHMTSPTTVLHDYVPACLQTGVLRAYSFPTPQYCLLPCLDVTMI